MSPTVGTSNSAIAREIEDLCNEMTAREEAGDSDAEAWFDDLLDSDFVIRRANGEYQGKRKFIRELKNGAGRGRAPQRPITVLFDREVAFAWLTIAVGTQRFRNVRIFRQSSSLRRGVAGWILEMWNNTETQASPSPGAESDDLELGSSGGVNGFRGIGSHLI